MIYQWLKPNFKQLMARKGRLPHALLLHGNVGIGKQDFAIAFAQALLCRQPAEHQQACGTCPSCNWFKEGAHPDFQWLKPENEEADEESTKKTRKKTIISVEQIRQLADFLALSSHQAGFKVVLISPADALNTASANALLKMLEEPPPNTLFLLVSSHTHRLLPTILSRCQAVLLNAPNHAEALAWLASQQVAQAENALALAGGSPLLALQAAEAPNLTRWLAQGRQLDIFAAAPHFLGDSMNTALQSLQKWVYDLVSIKLGHRARYHVADLAALQALCNRVNLKMLLQYQNHLTQAKKLADHPLNNPMQMENLLLQYTHLFN